MRLAVPRVASAKVRSVLDGRGWGRVETAWTDIALDSVAWGPSGRRFKACIPDHCPSDREGGFKARNRSPSNLTLPQALPQIAASLTLLPAL